MIPPGTAQDAHIRGQIWRNGTAVDGFSLDKISDCLTDPELLVWADLESPTHDHMRSLAAELDLDPWAVEDSLATAERVKSTRYAGHTFVVVYAVTLDEASTRLSGDIAGRVRLHRISVFIKKNTIITIRLSPDFDMDDVVARWQEIGGQIYGIGALVHGLLDVVVDGHFEAIQAMDDTIEQLEDLLFDDSRSIGRQLQREIYAFRKDLVQLRRVILPLREVIGSIQRIRLENHAPTELDPHFSDLYDHALRAAEWTESLRDMLSSVFETNLSLQDARLNTVMKKLTAWAAIIAVPTAITGYYGQNVPYPGYSHWSGFITSSALILIGIVLLYFVFRRRDWL